MQTFVYISTMKKHFIIFFFLTFWLATGAAQSAYRIKSDFLFKVKNPDSTFNLSKGVVYYDKNIKKLVFDLSFPEREIKVTKDTLVYTFRADTLYSIEKNLLAPEFTLFNYLLTDQFQTYGIDDKFFSADKVERSQGLVITHWKPKGKLSEVIGEIVIAQKQKRLYSVLIKNPEMEIINRQIFKNYKTIKGTIIPTEILSVFNVDTTRYLQITSLKNPVINETINEAIYDFDLK